ncbi:uncharacterized protein LOC134810458 isoform X2 [Pan troglodytes]|uniref:uncharacterized protein LOC134810458 isoform X2 n=2 Tax=Pan troglodytes TaxID=9598 RepID=UPI0030136AA6
MHLQGPLIPGSQAYNGLHGRRWDHLVAGKEGQDSQSFYIMPQPRCLTPLSLMQQEAPGERFSPILYFCHVLITVWWNLNDLLSRWINPSFPVLEYRKWMDKVLLYCPGWNVVVLSQLTASSTSQAQAVLPPQPPRWLRLYVLCHNAQLIFGLFLYMGSKGLTAKSIKQAPSTFVNTRTMRQAPGRQALNHQEHFTVFSPTKPVSGFLSLPASW